MVMYYQKDFTPSYTPPVWGYAKAKANVSTNGLFVAKDFVLEVTSGRKNVTCRVLKTNGGYLTVSIKEFEDYFIIVPKSEFIKPCWFGKKKVA